MEPTPSTPASQPVRLRDYELLELLGQGGMGAVYKARHTRLDKLVALKVLPASRLRDPNAVARFEREMKAVGKLDHPNIVRATDAGEVSGMRYLVMEFVDGLDVGRIARYAGPLSIADACEIVRQAALGLQDVHEAGLVHRDIKPSNLMLTDGGVVKILDLGLALLRECQTADHELTSSGQVVGTLDYMAPEQCSGSHVVDIRADIYSLGATAYRLLAGVAPLGDSPSPYEKMRMLLEEQARPLGELRSDVPEELALMLACAMAKDPADRFSAPAELAASLESYTRGHDLSALLRLCRERQKAAGEETHGDAPTPETLGMYVDSATLAYVAPQGRRSPGVRWTLVLLLMLMVVLGMAAVFRDSLRNALFPPGPRPTDTAGEVYVHEGHRAAIGSLALSADGRVLLSGGSKDKSLKVWDVRSGKVRHTLLGHTTEIRAVAISPDGTRGVSGGFAESLRFWDLETGRLLREFDGHVNRVGGVAFAPDGKRFASVGWDALLRVWNLETNERL